MGGAICIAVAIIGGLIAYWLFGDADRADRIAKAFGRYSPWSILIWAIWWALHGVHALFLAQWIDALWWLAGFAVCFSAWFWKRRQKSLSN